MNNRREMNLVNLSRWQAEQAEFAKMLPDMSVLPLKRIDITGDRNDHKHPDIRADRYYLFCRNGNWYLSQARLEWYGWIFNMGWGTTQLRNIDILFEIDLPDVLREPLGRVKLPDEDE